LKYSEIGKSKNPNFCKAINIIKLNFAPEFGKKFFPLRFWGIIKI